MRQLIPALVLTLAGLGCGQSVETVSLAPSELGASVSVSSPEPANATGLLSPARLTVRVPDVGLAGGVIDSGSVTLRDGQGAVIAQSNLPRTAIPQGGVGQVEVTLEWSPSSQAGKRLDWSLDVIDGSGRSHPLAGTVTFP